MTQEAWHVSTAEAGTRLDQFLAQKLPSHSRARVQQWIKQGLVQVNAGLRPAHYRVRAGDYLTCTPPVVQPWHLAPAAISLDIIYEDQDLLVLNKPPGMTVHPGAGQQEGTLAQALLHHCPDLQGVGDVQRPGLVHRLDKDTSGIMVVAKTAQALQHLQGQFQDRRVDKRYLALVHGRPTETRGTIEMGIGRHPTQRHKMAVIGRRRRPARTSWLRRREFCGLFSLLELTLHTGRTHQIRVHLAALGYPVVGDQVYGGGQRRLADLPRELSPLKELATRQLLHSWSLQFQHPRTGLPVRLEAPLPADFQAVLTFLEGLPCSR